VFRATGNNTNSQTGLAAFHFESSTGGYTFNGGIALHGEGVQRVVEGDANTGGVANFIDGSNICTDVLHLDAGAFVWTAEGISAAGCTNLVNDLTLTPNVVIPVSHYSKGFGLYTNGAIGAAAYIGRVDSFSGTHTVANNETWVNVTNSPTITINPALTGQFFYIFNNGTGNVTAAPSSGTLSGNGVVGGASITFGPGNLLWGLCDGTNCEVGVTGNSGVSFSQVAGGTNTNALVIGSGGSLGVSGTGTIAATSLSAASLLPNTTTAHTQAAGDTSTDVATDAFATAAGIAIPGFTSKTLASSVSVSANTATQIDSITRTMPSTGGPFRVLVGFNYFQSGGVNYDCWISDGTATWGPFEGGVTNNRSSCTGSTMSPVTYANGASVTFSIFVYNSGAATIETGSGVGSPAPGSAMNVSVFKSN